MRNHLVNFMRRYFLIGRTLVVGIIFVISVTSVLSLTQRQVFAQTVKEIQMSEEDNVVFATLIGEAANQGLDGMTAVAEVLRNRARQRHLTPSQVALQPLQFSFWNNKNKAAGFLLKEGTPAAYKMAQEAWKRSETSDLTHGANLYHAVNLLGTPKEPYWAKSPKVKKIGVIRDHIFYKE